MLVRIDNGHVVEDLGPVRPNWDFAPPRPVFWANDPREVLCRGLRRVAMANKRSDGAMPKGREFGAVEFGWGDAGETALAVYQSVGKMRLKTTSLTMAIVVQFKFGRTFEDAFRIKTRIDWWDDAQHQLLKVMYMPCYDSCSCRR